MKIISRIALLAIFIYIIFLYRNELSGIIGNIGNPTSKSTIENTSWAGMRKQAYEAYEFKDTEVAIDLLEDYLETVQQELQRHDYKDEGMATIRHDVVCELSIIHNKLSNKHYQMSDTDKYYYHETQYREYLSQCTNSDEDES